MDTLYISISLVILFQSHFTHEFYIVGKQLVSFSRYKCPNTSFKNICQFSIYTVAFQWYGIWPHKKLCNLDIVSSLN